MIRIYTFTQVLDLCTSSITGLSRFFIYEWDPFPLITVLLNHKMQNNENNKFLIDLKAEDLTVIFCCYNQFNW